MSQHLLSDEEQMTLTAVNKMLTRLTVTHHHACACELCEARMLTDVQDRPKLGWTVNDVTLDTDEEGVTP
jgi:hypothetical protein